MEAFEYNTLFKKISTTMEKIVNSTLQEHDVTISQWHYLNYLYSRGGEHIHLKDIENYFGVSQPTVVGILKRMKAKGYLYLEKADYSANSKAATLTEAGKQMCEYGLEKKKFVDELLIQPLTDEERITFGNLLTKIYDGMKDTAE